MEGTSCSAIFGLAGCLGKHQVAAWSGGMPVGHPGGTAAELNYRRLHGWPSFGMCVIGCFSSPPKVLQIVRSAHSRASTCSLHGYPT